MTAPAGPLPHDAPAGAAPSDWVVRWSQEVAPGSTVLDLACGAGRHVHWFAGRGARVTGVDRDASALARLAAACAAAGRPVELVAADLEGAAWPLGSRRFDAVVVTHYLWRPLLPAIVAAVDAGGLLVYETFGRDQASLGRPSNPDFLLAPGELLAAAAGLRILGYEDGFLDAPPRFVQRIAAVRERPATPPRRHALAAAAAAGPLAGGR